MNGRLVYVYCVTSTLQLTLKTNSLATNLSCINNNNKISSLHHNLEMGLEHSQDLMRSSLNWIQLTKIPEKNGQATHSIIIRILIHLIIVRTHLIRVILHSYCDSLQTMVNHNQFNIKAREILEATSIKN